MKKILILVLLSLTVPVLSVAQSKIKEAIIKTKIYCDHCKACETCKARIEHELNFTKGIKSFALDPDKQEIKVTYLTSKTNIDEIRTAINKAGYDADNKIADDRYVSKLDECCRKAN